MPAAVFTPGAVEIFIGVRLHEGENPPSSNPPAPTPGDEYPYPERPPPYEFDPPYVYPGYPYPTGPEYPPYSNYPPNSNYPTQSGENGGQQSSGVKAVYSEGGGVEAATGAENGCNFLNARWYYLGSAVVAPDVESEVIHTPLPFDLTAPAPFQVAFNSEWHRVTATLNRVNWRTYNRLRDSFFAAGSDIRKSFKTGGLVLHSEDVLLFVRYALPHVGAGFAPDAQSRGRIYYSAILANYHESAANSRVQEATVLFDCYALYCTKDRRFHLYTEADEDLPNLTPE